MLELFKLLGTIAVDNSEANKGIDETTGKAEKSHSKISGAFSKIGSAAVKVGKTIATGLAVGGAAIGALAKQSLDSYAEYEQLVGGIETLFKTSSGKVQEYANQAYQTAGLSANEYMSTVTSFSASLLQGLATVSDESVQVSIEALEREYEATEENSEKKLELLEEAHDKELEEFEALTDSKIALIDKQYQENLKLIDEEKYNKIKAIDEQIAALNAESEAEKKANEKRLQEEKRASLIQKINNAKTAEEKAKAQKEFANFIIDIQQKERDEQRKQQIEQLKDQKDAIKEEAETKKDALKEQYDTEMQAIKDSKEAQLKLIKKAQKNELQALKDSNKEKLTEMKSYIKEQTAILEANATSLVYSAETYEQAAEYANMAITDMSDNANKMGNDMSMIQTAYQGFAKNQYELLDNLRLGYGGTKEEMQRLIADAAKLDATVDAQSMSFDNVVRAIHAVQVEMGITGTTAQEASTTISGSLAMTKASWQNLLTGIAAGNQDMSVLVGNLATNISTTLGNIVPRVGQIVVGMKEAFVTAFPILLESVKDGFGKIWDYFSISLFDTGVSFEEGFSKIQEVFEIVWGELQDVWERIGQPIFDLIQSALAIVRDAFAERMPEISNFVSTVFSDIGDIWQNHLKPCFEAISNFLKTVLAPVFDYVFNRVIMPGADVAFNFIKNMWNNTLKPVFTGILDFITGVFTLDWEKAWNGIVGIFSGIWNGIKETFKLPINWIINKLNDFLTSLNGIQIPDWVPVVGGKGFHIDPIPTLEKGGILEKGQMGFLEGNGAEAVVPLDQNRAWISAVAKDMNTAIGADNTRLQKIIDLLEMLIDMFPEAMKEAFASMKFDVNNREFARLVKAVN